MKTLDLSVTTSILVSSLVLASIAAASTAGDGCSDGFSSGASTAIYTVPYPYSQVLSVIGSFRNITWNGIPYNNVTLNGTDNSVGTARSYAIEGTPVVETISDFSAPSNGPYQEVHTVEQVTFPGPNLTFYADYDATTVTSTCDNMASTFNFTTMFCANDPELGAGLLHQLHISDAETASRFLGGATFTSCDDLKTTSSKSGGMLTRTEVSWGILSGAFMLPLVL